MSIDITREEIETLYDVEAVTKSVEHAIREGMSSVASAARFLSRYANLNAWFGSGVASLSGKIGRSRGVFVDPDESIEDIADRSVLVASYFFDAARDEFDDRDTPHRDTHRCLAQACIKGAIFYEYEQIVSAINVCSGVINQDLAPPIWMTGIGDRVAAGYGVSTSGSVADLFRSMGYHVGSEILADHEFTFIDAALREQLPDLHAYLAANEFKIGETMHNGYAWISLHSGHGSSKEVDHFNWATQGVREAFKYTDQDHREELRHQVHLGVGSFVRDHQEFFAHVCGGP
jgi:hypothetical protein